MPLKPTSRRGPKPKPRQPPQPFTEAQHQYLLMMASDIKGVVHAALAPIQRHLALIETSTATAVRSLTKAVQTGRPVRRDLGNAVVVIEVPDGESMSEGCAADLGTGHFALREDRLVIRTNAGVVDLGSGGFTYNDSLLDVRLTAFPPGTAVTIRMA